MLPKKLPADSMNTENIPSPDIGTPAPRMPLRVEK
jgi:hypothetical protein